MHHVQPDTGTTTRTQPPVVRGFGRGWTLGRKLLAVGSVGAILAASVVQSSLSGIARVNTANRAVRSTERVQRYQQDADMMHDALHSDVLSAVLTGQGSGSIPPRRSGRAWRVSIARNARHTNERKETALFMTSGAEFRVRAAEPSGHADRQGGTGGAGTKRKARRDTLHRNNGRLDVW